MGWKTFKPNRLVCPHCGYDGTTPPEKHQESYDVPAFYWLEDTTVVWSLVAVAGKAVERGTIQLDEAPDISDDSFNPRLECGKCHGEFPVPDGVMSDYIGYGEEDWSENPRSILCPECRCLSLPCEENGACYHCTKCRFVTGQCRGGA